MPFTIQLRSLGALAVLAIVGCASPPAPEWLEGGHEGFPEDRWVVAVGAGATATAAEAHARDKISIDTAGETEGIGIAETWNDAATGTHWAMAVLDRKALLEQLSRERTEIEPELSATLARAEEASPDDALLILTRARRLLTERDVLVERLAHLGTPLPPAAPATRKVERAEIERRLAATRQLLPIEIESYEMHPRTGETGDPIDGMRRALAQSVIGLGFPVSDGNVGWGDSPTWLVVRSRLALDRLELHPADSLVAIRWDAALEIVETESGSQLVAELTEQGRGTHLNEREARRAAQEEATRFVSEALRKWLAERTGSSNPTLE